MTQKDLFPHTISSPQVTPVSRSVSQVNKGALKMTATSGRTSLELLHTKDRLGAFSKTFMVTLPWASTKCCLTWKPKATPQGRLLFQLQVSTLPIEETGSGLLHTPTATANQMSPSMVNRDKGSWGKIKNWPTPTASDVEGGIAQDVELENGTFSRKNKDGVRWGVKLRDAVNHTEKMWPTPRANEPGRTTEGYGRGLAELVEGKTQLPKNWPTPRASEWKDCGPVGSKSHTHMLERKYLCAEVKEEDKPTGKLNPTWVEWLMGYPEGWTDLKD